MKSIILAGASRSGKTTLARRLQKETGFSRISGDAFMCTFQTAFPQLGINEHDDAETVSKRMEEFHVIYMKMLNDYEHVPFVLDTVHFMPEQIARLKLHEKYNVLFFGYPNMDAEQKLKEIRQYNTEHFDWTNERTEENLLENLDRFIKHSKKLQTQCALLGLNFIDTGNNFQEALNKAHSLII